MSFTIRQVWLFVAKDENGVEGLPCVAIGGMPYPLLACDEARLSSFVPVAKSLAAQSGRAIELRLFTKPRTVEVFGSGSVPR